MDRFYRTQETPATTDQKEYLKKYLGNGKKKKKAKAPKGKGTRIVDDDVVAAAPADEEADEGLLDAPDERPQVAGVVPITPAATNSDKRWKTLDECDLDELESQREILSESLKRLEGSGAAGASSSSDETAPSAKKSSQRRAGSESSGGGLATSDSGSGSEAESVDRRPRARHDSDDSAVRKRTRHDSDESPARRRERRPAADAESPTKRQRPRAGSDESPPRRRPATRPDSSDESPPRNRAEQGSRRRADGSDESPERRRPGGGAPGRARHDSDPSPPRRRTGDKKSMASDNGGSVHRRPESDNPARSSARRDEKARSSDASQRRERGQSRSPRRPAADEERRGPRRARHDSDTSPPRRVRGRDGSAESGSPPRSWRRPANSSRTDSPPGAPPSHTQDGRKAGLQDINALREENRAVRRRDHTAIAEMDETVSGRHAETKIRGRKLQEINEKAAKKAEEEAKAKERMKKYDAWGKGLKQAEDRRARAEHHQHQASKPLARYADDDDLENELRRRQRQDDPMAEYMQRKKTKNTGPLKERPRYNKSEPPPNRYGIWPGYRWDGVDRSNGFEKELFLRRNEKKARDTDAYKWSTEDM